MGAALMPVRGSEVHRAADGLVAEVYTIDPTKDLVTLRWRAGRKWETRVCTSEQFHQYWAVARVGPAKRFVKVALIVAAVIIAVLVILVLVGTSDSGPSGNTTSGKASIDSAPPNEPTKSPDTPAVQPLTVAQLSDANFLDGKYEIAAESSCEADSEDYLRSIAKFDYGWDKTGFMESKFDKIMKQVVKPGVLTLVTHKAKLQNGFGAFEHITLYCDYDTQGDKVLEFRVDE